MPEHVRTDDVVSRSELTEILGDDDLRDVIPVCAGEWRKEKLANDDRGDHWRFWKHPCEED